MRISELAATTGVPLPSIKYYLREGLLMPGAARGATQADYDDEHVRRLRLIRALADVAGLPIQRIKTILALADQPGDDLYDTLGSAVAALPPYAQPDESRDYTRARAAIDRIGQVYDPDFAAVPQLERALCAVEDAGIPMSDDRLDCYAEHLRAIAEFDLSHMPQGAPSDAIEYAVLGTALYDPVIVALRRLAHQDAAAHRLGRVD